MTSQKIWMKNWAGTWSFLFASFYGRNYTKGLQDFVGACFPNNIVAHEKGISSNYFPKDELDTFCKACVEYITSHDKAAEDWCDQVFKRTDEVMALLGELDKKQTYTKADYEQVKQAFFDHVPPNFSIKKVIDYLPKDFVDNYLELFGKMRVYTEPVYGAIDRMLLKIASSLTGLPKEPVSVLTREEIEKFLEGTPLPSKTELRERIHGVALRFNEKGEGSLFSGKQFTSLMENLLNTSARKEIKGSIAYKGKAQGKVRIIHDPHNPGQFNKGDILVTGMTRPEFLQLMEKSAAFITDAGGLLSHAAIVAREMKKPCLIGTEIATKILKDGDMVEVDAEKGFVRIL
jgi:phosphohistidine swiveling domain-containing protein